MLAHGGALMAWEVGQTGYLIGKVSFGPKRGSYAEPVPVKITKVGKRWAYYAHALGHRDGRFEMESGNVDAGEYTSEDYVWPSLEAFAEYAAAKAAWRGLRDLIGFGPPPSGLTSGEISAFAARVKACREKS